MLGALQRRKTRPNLHPPGHWETALVRVFHLYLQLHTAGRELCPFTSQMMKLRSEKGSDSTKASSKVESPPLPRAAKRLSVKYAC